MSGAILGRELVRRTVEAADGLVSGSPLTEAVVATLGGSVDAVMDWSFQDRRPAEYGALMPLFFDHYDKGDPVAHKMMEIELGYIDTYVALVQGARRHSHGHCRRLRRAPVPLLQQRYGDFVVRPQYEPLHGAVILAKQNFAA